MRTLVVNIGNSSLFCGVFDGPKRRRAFRLRPAELAALPQRVGGAPDQAIVCSVVPARTGPVCRLIRRRWRIAPRILTATAAHGLRIGYREPAALGADRVAAALGARALLPGRNVIVVDCGTATTVTALGTDGTLHGGAIFPGVGLWSDLLARRTAQLPRVVVARPRHALGHSPREGIASGLFFGHVGAIRETVARIRREAFRRRPVVVVGTGGNAAAFAGEGLFTRIEPELVLVGLREFGREGE